MFYCYLSIHYGFSGPLRHQRASGFDQTSDAACPAHLIRVRRQDPQGIPALVYNRHAATEIRRWLFDLLGGMPAV